MSRYTRWLWGFFATGSLLLWPAVSRGDILSENFNELSPTTLNAPSPVGAFSVTAGTVDLLGGAVFGSLCAAPEGGNCVDMDGSNGHAGQLTSAPLTFAPGTYTLSFDLIGSQRGPTTSTTVTLGSLYNQTFVLASNDDTDGIVNFTFTVGSTTVAPLVFTSNDGASVIGALLDNVDITGSGTGTTPTPEPATLAMLAVGLLSLAAGHKLAIGK
jgi:PEP-CTERM motif-containing protein